MCFFFCFVFIYDPYVYLYMDSMRVKKKSHCKAEGFHSKSTEINRQEWSSLRANQISVCKRRVWDTVFLGATFRKNPCEVVRNGPAANSAPSVTLTSYNAELLGREAARGRFAMVPICILISDCVVWGSGYILQPRLVSVTSVGLNQ